MESLVGTNLLRSPLAVTQLRRNPQLNLAALANEFHTLGPAFDYLVQSERNGVATLIRRIKHGAVFEFTLVAYFYVVGVVYSFFLTTSEKNIMLIIRMGYYFQLIKVHYHIALYNLICI